MPPPLFFYWSHRHPVRQATDATGSQGDRQPVIPIYLYTYISIYLCTYIPIYLYTYIPIPNEVQNDPKTTSKRLPKRPQNDLKLASNGAPWVPLEGPLRDLPPPPK